jgi:hypothetical protein
MKILVLDVPNDVAADVDFLRTCADSCADPELRVKNRREWACGIPGTEREEGRASRESQ